MFIELAKKRYSCRSFKALPVEQEKIDRLLEAAMLAPTARNQQPIRIKLITTVGDREKVKLCTPCHFDAPLIALICFDKTECWTRPEDGLSSGYIDASIVETHIMLEAADLGLGSTWVLKFNPFETIKQFGLDENIIPAGFLMMGYPSEDAVPSPRHFESKKASDIIL